ncbi:MAG TPA: hypothetical protein VKY62_04080 [Devosia sp.]|nr:hypothetical protein [Devosia sp.]
MWYSFETGGFYSSEIGQLIPDGAVELNAAEYLELINGVADGKCVIKGAGGKPELHDPRAGHVWACRDGQAVERAWRDMQIMSVEWMRARHRDQLEIGAPTTLTAEQYQELLQYMQALRDWPQSAEFPAQEYRPVPAEWMLAPDGDLH